MSIADPRSILRLAGSSPPKNEAAADQKEMVDTPLALRRKAPLHFHAKADNARFVAYLLAQGTSAESLSLAATRSGYQRTPSIAMHESFLRESALALELIVKAVIAQKIELGTAPPGVLSVSAVHDLPRLWGEAGLPSLSSEDQRRLLIVKSLLTWSGVTQLRTPINSSTRKRPLMIGSARRNRRSIAKCGIGKTSTGSTRSQTKSFVGCDRMRRRGHSG